VGTTIISTLIRRFVETGRSTSTFKKTGQVERSFLLDVVLKESADVVELLSSKGQTLLVH
jgi:hypothetical protein